ncbi:hypothetical protein E2C00_01125 [Streptomyces sp. WAC05374]|nr:hypothetical protein EF905_12540 [Streptomyces sp. WAC05374]TDF50147.1 hypothetical protein E2B92_01100 [Streptomyces sp. WAC05374]TDF57872.1 hypothetical protein E2C02_08890 [Streptomyces sp. WAC05374]TDF60401.1 hypothetical protein E2C00_01125 [Streptomyces sp. WAC05374]
MGEAFKSIDEICGGIAVERAGSPRSHAWLPITAVSDEAWFQQPLTSRSRGEEEPMAEQCKAEHGLGHRHANAFVAHTLAEGTGT